MKLKENEGHRSLKEVNKVMEAEEKKERNAGLKQLRRNDSESD